MKYSVIFFLFSLFGPSFFSHAHNFVYVDFDTAMQFEEFGHHIVSEHTTAYLKIPYHMLELFFRNLYEKNSFLYVAKKKRTRIPKIIHQIWIGKKVPEKFKAFQESWKEHHPDWEYKLWTQHDLYEFGFENIDLIKESRNPGEISDMMRYEILLRYGGVYVDFDFECLKPLDDLNHMYDFYIGIQPIDCGHLQLGIGLIGAVAGHPILRRAVSALREGWDLPENKQNPPARTGPVFFTQVFYESANQDGYIDIALPAHYIYPMPCKDFTLKKKKWLDQGALGIHYWAGSWMYPKFRRKEFRELD